MDSSLVQIDSLLSSAFLSIPDENNFSSLSHLLLQHKKYSELLTLLSTYPSLKLPFLRILLSFQETTHDLSNFHDFFSSVFLSDVDFFQLSPLELIHLQHAIWEVLLKTNLQNLREISELFLKFSIKIQIAPMIHESLLIHTVKTLRPRVFEIMSRRGFFQLDDEGYNGLIHLVEVFPKNCAKILKDLLFEGSPKLYDSEMKNLLLSIYMQEKFAPEEKITLFKTLSEKIKDSGLKELIFAVDVKGNHLLSVLISSRNLDLFKETMKIVKKTTGLRTTEIINKYFEDYQSFSLLQYEEYQKYMTRFTNKKIENPQKFSRFLPINLIEAAIQARFPLIIKYLLKKRYNSEAFTRSHLQYIELLAFSATNSSSLNSEEEISEVLSILYDANLFRAREEENLEQSFSYFDENILSKFKKTSRSRSRSPSKHNVSNLVNVKSKEKIIETLAILDNPDLFVSLFPPLKITPESKSFCFYYIVSICQCIHHRAVRILRTISEYYSVKYLVENIDSVFSDLGNMRDVFSEALMERAEVDLELKEIVKELVYPNQQKEEIAKKNYGNSLKFISLFNDMGCAKADDISEVLFKYLRETVEEWQISHDYLLENLKNYEKLYNFKILDVRSTKTALVCKLINYFIMNNFEITLILNHLNELLRLDYEKFGLILLEDEIQNYLFDNLCEILEKFLKESSKRCTFEGKFRIFEDFHNSLESSVVYSICLKNPEIISNRLDLMIELNLDSFELLWKEQNLESVDFFYFKRFMQLCKDIHLFLKLFDLALSLIIERSTEEKDSESENKSFQIYISNLQSYIFQLVDMFKLKGGDDIIIQKIQTLNLSSTFIAVLKSASYLQKINPSLSFVSVMKLESLINHISLNIKLYQSQDDIFKESVSHLILPLYNEEKIIKGLKPSRNKFMKVLIQINHKKSLIERISECELEDIIFFLRTLKSLEIFNKLLLYFAYNCMKTKLLSIKNLYQVSVETFQSINFNAAYGRNWHKYCLSNDQLNIPVNFKSQPLMQDEIFFETSHNRNFLVSLGFLGDRILFDVLKDCKDLKLLVEICFKTVKGYDSSKKYCLGKRSAILKGFKKIFNFFIKVFEKESLEGVEHDYDSSEIVEICVKNKLIKLLICLIPLLKTESQRYSKFLFLKVSMSNLKLKRMIDKISKMKNIGLSPVEFFIEAINKNLAVLRKIKIVLYFLEAFPELQIYIKNFMNNIGKFKVMKFYNSFSELGICKYGKQVDMENYLLEFPETNLKIPEFCKSAIKSRNTSLITFLIEKMSNDQCLELISSNNCEILFHMAFYCLDSELCMIIYKLGSDCLRQFASNTLYNMSIFSIRISNGQYSEAWEPLNYILYDLSSNVKFLLIYLKKLLEYKTGILLSFEIELRESCAILDLIDDIHSTVVLLPIEKIEKIGPLIWALKLIPSFKFIMNIKKMEILKIYMKFLYGDYSHLNLPQAALVYSDYEANLETLHENYLLILAVLGDKSLALHQMSSEMNSKVVRCLLIHGKHSLCIFRSLHFANDRKSLDDVWEFIHDDVKSPIIISFILIGGGDLHAFLPNLLDDIEINFSFESIFKLKNYLVKSLQILNDYSTFLTYRFTIEKGAYSQISNILNKIILKCKAKCQEFRLKVRTSQEVSSLVPFLSQSENILFYTSIIQCYIISFEYFSNYRIKKFIIDLNKEIENIYQNLPKKVKISLNVENKDGKRNFISISSPDVFVIDRDVLVSDIETCSKLGINFKIAEMPNSYEELSALKVYFDDESNSLYDLISFKCIEFYDEKKMALDPACYSNDLIDDFKEFFIGEEILLREVKEVPLNCKETSTVFYKLSKTQKETGKFKEPEIKLKLFDHTFYKFLLFKCRNMLKGLSKKFMIISNIPIEMNYNKFLKEIAFPESDSTNCNIILIIQKFFLKLEPVLLYISKGSEVLTQNQIANYIDFHFDSNNPKIYKTSEIQVYSIPVISTGSQNSMFEFCCPDLEYVFEDHLISLLSPKEIFNLVLDPSTFDSLLSLKKEQFFFMFIVDWESIFQFFLKDFEFPSSRKTIRSLKKLSEELYTSLILKDSLYSIFEEDIWEFAILLNSFSNIADCFNIQKVTADEEFWRKSNNCRKCFIYNTIDEMFLTVETMTPKVLSKATSLCIGLNSGIWNVPNSSLPTLDSNLQVAYPSSGNILQPFPNILNISVNPNENPNILLKVKHYEGHLRTSDDHSIISFEIQPFKSFLRNFFWFSFSLNKSIISNYFLKFLNSSIKAEKTFFNEKKFSISKGVRKKAFKWNPTFELTWNEFAESKFEVDQGLSIADNILKKFREFLECIDLIYNSIGNFNAFHSVQGYLYLRPKRSLLRKVIARNIQKIIIKVTKEEGICFKEPGELELSLNPLNELSSLTKELIVSTLSNHILVSDKGNKEFNVQIQDKNMTGLGYLKMIEKLELYSQIPLIVTFTALASKLYFPEVHYKVVIKLDQWKNQYSVKGINDSELKLTFGRLFYNKLNLITFGEECMRQLSVYRPVNRVIVSTIIPSTYNTDQTNANILIPSTNSKSYSSRKLEARLIKIKENSKNPDYLIVHFFKNFPVFYIFIGESSLNHVQTRLKYDFFCMLVQKNSFNPVVKSSRLSKIKLNPEAHSTTIVTSDTEFTCFLFSYGEPGVIIHNSKNKSVNYEITPDENQTIWQDYRVFKITFRTTSIGHYYFYNKNIILPADFLTSRAQLIDASNSTIEYKKTTDTFLLTFNDSKNEKIILTVPKDHENSKNFILNHSKVSIRFFLEDNSECKHFLKFKMNTIIASYESPSKDAKVQFEVLVNDVHIKHSPCIFESNNNFTKRYQKFIEENSKSAYFNIDETLYIKRNTFFESLNNNLPKGNSSKSLFYVVYENEQGVDVGGVKRDFYDCLGSYATLPNLKLFEKRKEFYRIHPESNPDMMESIGSAFANGIIHEYKVPIALCDSLLKCVLGQKIIPDDLKAEDPDLYNSYLEIMTMSEGDLNNCGFYFSASSNGSIVPLIHGGEKIQVTTENREKYFKLIIKWELKGYAKKSIEKFVKGFNAVAVNLKTLRCDEIRFIMSGFDENDAEFVKSSIDHGSASMKRVKMWLVDWLNQIDLESIKKFLKFSTGNSMVPIKRDYWKIIVNKGNGKLPISHTCFYTIDVPNYQTFEELCKGFQIAIEFGCEGFGNA